MERAAKDNGSKRFARSETETKRLQILRQAITSLPEADRIRVEEWVKGEVWSRKCDEAGELCTNGTQMGMMIYLGIDRCEDAFVHALGLAEDSPPEEGKEGMASVRD